MIDEKIYYLTADSLVSLKQELENLKNITIPEIASHIDSARQQGDLSENAEYHQAREDMSWAQGRLVEIEQILSNTRVITKSENIGGAIQIGNTIKLVVNGNEKEYTIVGPQEVNPLKGLISNESPIGEALIGHAKGDEVSINTPAGMQTYKIIEVR